MAMFKVLRDAVNEPKAKAETIVYGARVHDYGMARDDTNTTNVEHVSVTLESHGGYPVFTIPVGDLERQE